MQGDRSMLICVRELPWSERTFIVCNVANRSHAEETMKFIINEQSILAELKGFSFLKCLDSLLDSFQNIGFVQIGEKGDESINVMLDNWYSGVTRHMLQYIWPNFFDDEY